MLTYEPCITLCINSMNEMNLLQYNYDQTIHTHNSERLKKKDIKKITTTTIPLIQWCVLLLYSLISFLFFCEQGKHSFLKNFLKSNSFLAGIRWINRLDQLVKHSSFFNLLGCFQAVCLSFLQSWKFQYEEERHEPQIIR